MLIFGLQKLPIFLTLVTISGQERLSNTYPTNKDAGLNIYQLAKAHGYPLETYQLETQDGYILTIHRIPHGVNNSNETNKPVVFMMHGIISSSVDWINIGPGKSLAYLLADQGYDVWLGNARGNMFSRKHTTLNPDKDKKTFWDFSWNEIGYYDLPAFIDYALNATYQKQLQYVGFSQGSTTFLVMASSRPEYNDKIKFATLLAPPGEISHMKQLFFRLVSHFARIIYNVFNGLGIYEVLPRTQLMEYLGIMFCDDYAPTQVLCKACIYAFIGHDKEQLVGSFIPVITSNSPAGGSIKQFLHYGQSIQGSFRKFDYYNLTENMKHYGSSKPPKYELGKITAPVAMYYGANDIMVSDVDAKLTASQMPNVVYLKEVEYSKWSHFDFVYAKDVSEILYKEVIMFMNKYK